MAALSSAWTWLKGVPEWFWITLLAMFGLFIVRKDAREDERRASDARHAREAAAQAKQIRERAEDAEDTSNRVRDRGRYDDERMRDTEADPVPGYHFRDGKSDHD